MHTLMLKDKLTLRKQFIAYLDKVHALKNLENEALKYEKSIGEHSSLKTGGAVCMPQFRFVVPLDLLRMQLENFDKLFYLFILEPDSATEIARDAILSSVREITGLGKTVTKLEIEVLTHMSVVPSVFFHLTEMLRGELKCFTGILTTKSTPVSYVRGSMYVCRTEGCPAANENREEKRIRPFATQLCKHCFKTLDEEVRFRQVGEEIVCELVAGFGTTQSFGKFPSSVGKIKDELGSVMELTLGKSYNLIGKRDKNGCIDVWHVSSTSSSRNFNSVSEFISLPHFVSELYLSVKRSLSQTSPWAFVVAISSSLGQNFLPNTSFLHLKTGLMFSLATQSGNEMPVSIIAVGTDTSVARKLFRSGGRLAERYISYSTEFSYLGGSIKRESQTGATRGEAGALIFGTEGICDLGDWAKFRKNQSHYLCNTLERGQIIFSNSDAELNNFTHFVPLKCSVWSYFNCASASKKIDLETRLKALTNVFGMPFLINEENEIEMEKICNKHLGNCLKEDDVYRIPEAELREYMELVRKKHCLPIREDASELIKNYFVASRKDRPGCLPVGAIKTITALSEAHAKMALRTEVLYEDVVAVAYWYQQAAIVLFGPSGFDFRLAATEDNNKPPYVLMDERLRSFSSWLSNYVNIFTTNKLI